MHVFELLVSTVHPTQPNTDHHYKLRQFSTGTNQAAISHDMHAAATSANHHIFSVPNKSAIYFN